MKQAKIFFPIIVYASLLFFSCNTNNNAANAGKGSASASSSNSPAASTSSSTGNTVFSYNLDGTKISGGKVDEEMRSNVAIISHSSDYDNKLSFFLNDAYIDNAEKYAHSLNFTIPDKTGTITIAADDDNLRMQLFLATPADAKYTYILYGSESFTVTVTDISASRVSGTFSGKVKKAEQQGAAKDEFTITDGKFDIPFRIDQK